MEETLGSHDFSLSREYPTYSGRSGGGGNFSPINQPTESQASRWEAMCVSPTGAGPARAGWRFHRHMGFGWGELGDEHQQMAVFWGFGEGGHFYN